MGVIDSIFSKRAGADYDGYYVDNIPGLLASILPTNTNIVVNEYTALNYTGYYACVKVISETIATIPFHIYKRLKPRGKERAIEHPLYFLLSDEPNPEMDSFEFRETMMVHLLTWGNAYSNIERNNANGIKALWPLRPDRIDIIRKDGRLWYIYKMPNGERRKLRHENVFHIRGLSSNGIKGLAPLQQAREAIALGIGSEKFTGKFLDNNAKPGGYLEHPGTVGPKGKKNLETSWQEMHGGLDNVNRIAILEEGMKFHDVGVPPESAQLLETRKFQLLEMCRIHRLQAHKVQHLEDASLKNIEHQSIEFTIDTIQPWGTRIERATKKQLFVKEDKLDYFPAFLLDGLLRGDIRTRYQAYKIGREIAVLSTNDIREMENRNPIRKDDGNFDPAGDKYHLLNIWTELGKEPPAVLAPSSTKKEPKEEKKESELEIETRKQEVVADMVILRERYKPLFKDAFERIVRIEVADIGRAIDKQFPKRDVIEFEHWLETFYEKYQAKIGKVLTPVINSYGEAVHSLAASEIGASLEMDAEIRKFIGNYLSVYTKRHAGSSVDQLKALLRDTHPDEVVSILKGRLDEWLAQRPETIASDEVVRASNAIARETYKNAGVTKLVWVAAGSDVCPFARNSTALSSG